MALLINMPGRSLDKLLARLQQDIASDEIQVWPNLTAPEAIELALVWQHPAGSLSGLPNLKGISSFGAGVDAILSDPDLPQVPIARIVDPALATNMAKFVLTQIQDHKLRLAQFRQQESEALWKPKSQRPANRIGILGLGQLGAETARLLSLFGFDVTGWSRSEKQLEKVRCLTGQDGLDELLSNCDYLVCLLPLTEETNNILNTKVFSKMPKEAVLINVARGQHVDDDALLAALDEGMLDYAYLDVFCQEPLPATHSFWHHPKIRVTPHISAVTNVDTAVEQIVANYHRIKQKTPMLNTIDPERGY